MRSALVLALALAASAASAAEPAAECAVLAGIVEAARPGFRSLRSQEFSHKYESWQSRATLPGFDACWIDDVNRGFWCLHQAPSVAEALRLAERQAALIGRCYPQAPSALQVESMDNNVTREIRDWAVGAERRLRLVTRRPTTGAGLGAVFLYAY